MRQSKESKADIYLTLFEESVYQLKNLYKSGKEFEDKYAMRRKILLDLLIKSDMFEDDIH